jgi:hypothetical protein
MNRQNSEKQNRCQKRVLLKEERMWVSRMCVFSERMKEERKRDKMKE